jgi:DNA-binding NtrC family response regulator
VYITLSTSPWSTLLQSKRKMNYLGKEISSKASVLILDDDFDIVTLMKIGLQHNSFNVYGFTDPALALEHFGMNAKSYDLVISDIRMPQMNGFEFIKKVKEIKPEIKVFLMTAFEINDIEFRRVLPSTRIDEFIQKPISIERLNTLVRTHVKNRRKKI